MTTTEILKGCEEAVATRWSCPRISTPQIRFYRGDYFTVRGQFVFVQPLYAVACDRTGFCPDADTSGHIRVVAKLLEVSEEVAKLVYDAANGEEPLNPKERSRVMEVRIELVERIARQQAGSHLSWWSLLKARS